MAAPNALDETLTYYLIASDEQASLVERLFNDLVPNGRVGGAANRERIIRIVTTAEEETNVRRTIDDANRQVQAYAEPGFRIVDLRP
jgi:hypothetical protein